MARINWPVHIPQPTTHEGAPAARISPTAALRRSVLSCMLWEKEFYEDGEEIADRIMRLAGEVVKAQHGMTVFDASGKGHPGGLATLAALAIETRTQAKLRHVPLVLLAALARHGRGSSLVSETIAATIQRADELAEFLAVYARLNGVTPDKLKPKLSAQVKKGLAAAFTKFDAYALAKYDRAGAVRLRDVLFLSHAKPRTPEQAETWQALIDGTLASPDTWEVALSGGADKRETFERLLAEGKLGYLALLRNLRNMEQAGVSRDAMTQAILARKGADKVLPFRYTAAARACPQMEPYLDTALQAAINDLPRLPGHTVVLVDVSDSMNDKLSAKSDLTRMDAAATLASIINAESLRVFTFSQAIVEVPPRRGMAGVDAIIRSQLHGGTYLGQALQTIYSQVPFDRLIVITDEQSHDAVRLPVTHAKGYLINVASARNGVGYGSGWTHIDGFSENVIRFIHELENAE